jgi:hypothetical protein
MFMQDITRNNITFRPVETLPLPVTTGLVAGTLVETATGWRAVEYLSIGDAVHTLDGGLARILGLDRRALHPDQAAALLLILGGTFDACSDLMLLQGQHILLDTLDDPDLGGAAFAFVPAAALASAGAHRAHLHAPVEIVTPLFADEEVIYANSGVLLHCPGIADGAGRYPEDSAFLRLDRAEARRFVQRRAVRLAA